MKLPSISLSLLVTIALFLALLVAPIEAAQSPDGLRGIWLRPPATKEEAIQQLDNIEKAGFNVIYLETFYHGFTIYPSRYVPIRPEMEGTDFLKLYIDEGKKRGLEIHAWIEVFYWAVDTEKYPQHPKCKLFEGHEDWKAIVRDGTTTETMEPAHIFANPAHPEVRQFLVTYMQELMENYDIHGLNLDYIRYPDGSLDTGYSEYTRNAYKKVSGVDPMEIEKDPAAPAWQKWCEWREAQVLEMIWQIRRVKDIVNEDVILSAAIFPGPASDRYTKTKFQNWRKMMTNGSLDAIIPMTYNPSLQGIEDRLTDMKSEMNLEVKTDLLPVLAIQRNTTDWYAGTGHPPIVDQEKVLEKLEIPGFSIFCYSWMMDSDEGLKLFVEKEKK